MVSQRGLKGLSMEYKWLQHSSTWVNITKLLKSKVHKSQLEIHFILGGSHGEKIKLTIHMGGIKQLQSMSYKESANKNKERT